MKKSKRETYYGEENERIGNIPCPCPFDSERMKPLKDTASEGRANPEGISYMYLSTDKDTAMAEVRPWVGSSISVAQFKLLKKIKLINCTSEHKDRSKIIIRTEKGVEPEVEPERREGFVWKDIDKAFSIPVTLNETTADYVPTQIMAELFKNEGLDGIAYRSSLGKGHNVTLFDLDIADLINCTLYKAEKPVAFSFVPYYYKNKNDTQ